MDGAAYLGAGIGVGPPLAALIIVVGKYLSRNGQQQSQPEPQPRPEQLEQPGVSDICRTHGQRIGVVEVASGVLAEGVKNIRASLERVEKRLERIEKRLEHLGDS